MNLVWQKPFSLLLSLCLSLLFLQTSITFHTNIFEEQLYKYTPYCLSFHIVSEICSAIEYRVNRRSFYCSVEHYFYILQLN